MGRAIRKEVLGERVRNFAATRGIPISALEKESGFSAGMISRWIAAGNEDYNALSKLVNLSDLLGVSLVELVGRQNSHPSQSKTDTPRIPTSARNTRFCPTAPPTGTAAGNIAVIQKSAPSALPGIYVPNPRTA